MSKQNLTPMPSLHSDEEAENFVDTADLTEYDLSNFTAERFEFETKPATLNHKPSADSNLTACTINITHER